MSTNPKKRENGAKNELNNIKNLGDAFFFGLILTDEEGDIIYKNKVADKLIAVNPDTVQKKFKQIIEMVLKHSNELVKDFPVGDRILRFHARHIDKISKFAVLGIVRDVTEEWVEEKQKDVLEYIANSYAQTIPTLDWIDAILNRIKTMMDVESISLMLYSHKNNNLETVTGTKKKYNEDSIKLGEGIAGTAAQKQQTITILNTVKDKKYKYVGKKQEKAKSILAIPMLTNTKLIGVLNVNKEAGKYFREYDKMFYMLIANNLAAAIEQRKLLEKLKQQYARLHAVITSTNQSKVLVGNKNQVLMLNPSFSRLLQKEENEIKEKKITDLLPEIDALIKKKQSRYYEEVRLDSLAGQPWVGIYVAKIKRNNTQNIVLTIRDITAEKQLEQLKNDFIATTTHELRTPLTTMVGYMSMLKNKGKLSGKQNKYLDRMEKAAGNLSNLIEDLLSVFRIDQEAVKLKPKKVDLLAIIKEVVNSLESKIKNKKIKVVLPKTKNYAHTDSDTLQRVLLNLIDNAVKYSKQSGRVEIKLLKTNNDKFVKVEVEDTGIGIPQKEHKKIFNKFHRAHNELSVEAGGTGLGLYISKKLVQGWGGELKLERSSPEGSTFSFTVPATKETYVQQIQKSK